MIAITINRNGNEMVWYYDANENQMETIEYFAAALDSLEKHGGLFTMSAVKTS